MKKKRTPMKRVHWLPETIYPTAIGVVDNEEAWHRELKIRKMPRQHWPEWFPEKAEAKCQTIYNESGGLTAIVIMVKNDIVIDAFGVGTIVHEADHAVNFIADAIGERTYGFETRAYLIGWITEKILEILLK